LLLVGNLKYAAGLQKECSVLQAACLPLKPREIIVVGLQPAEAAVAQGDLGISIASSRCREISMGFISRPYEPMRQVTSMGDMNEPDGSRFSDDVKRDAEPRIARLEDNERQIIALVAAGFNDRQISETFQTSETRMHEQLTTIYDKLGISDRFELVVYAYYHHLVGMPH
jgi:DNA-binding CsgD family transcriptional regulator